MSSSSVESSSLNLIIKRDFLKWLHAHSFIDDIGIAKHDLSYNQFWATHPEIEMFLFEGAFDNKFRTSVEVGLFNDNYIDLLKKTGLADKHKANLLYITLINYIDTEKQSLTYNTQIRLHEYTKFIIDLANNCLKHREEMLKNDRYVQVYNIYTREYIFVATKLIIELDALNDEDMLDYISDDIVLYDIISFYDLKLYVPLTFSFQITDNAKMQFKSIDGSDITCVTLPNQFRHELLKFTIEAMLKEHERHKTEFYKRIVDGELPIMFYKDIYKQSYRKDIGGNRLKLTSIVLSDYLKEFTRLSNPSARAHFIFELLCLLKGFNHPKDIEAPENLNELKSFYLKQGFSSETIRQYIKD